MDRLEAIKKRHQPKCYYQGENFEITIQPDPDVTWLISKVAEQDREIAEWKQEHDMVHRQQLETVKLCDRETIRDEKAEAALADARKVYTAHATEAEKQIDELQARVKELEQELSWAADACEKAEKLLVEKEKV